MSMKIRIFKGRASILFGVAMFVAAPAFGGITFDCDSSIAADFRAGTCSYLELHGGSSVWQHIHKRERQRLY